MNTVYFHLHIIVVTQIPMKALSLCSLLFRRIGMAARHTLIICLPLKHKTCVFCMDLQLIVCIWNYSNLPLNCVLCAVYTVLCIKLTCCYWLDYYKFWFECMFQFFHLKTFQFHHILSFHTTQQLYSKYTYMFNGLWIHRRWIILNAFTPFGECFVWKFLFWPSISLYQVIQNSRLKIINDASIRIAHINSINHWNIRAGKLEKYTLPD